MKSKLQLIPTAGMSREAWLAYRHTGIGASDVGTILGLDDYKSSLELFYYKIGDVPKFDTENMARFMGLQHEDLIADLWQYWERDEDTMIRNFRAGRIVRRCQRVNAYIRNPDYPWLYVSLDRKINRTKDRGEGSLELKTINSWEADKWEAGIPPKYVTQLATQLLVPEFDHGELALLQDGRKMYVYPFEFMPNIAQHVITQTKSFWDRVVAGRKLVNEKYLALTQFNQRRVEECNAEIDKLAPEPDGSLAYAAYLKEKFQRPSSAERRGNEVELAAAIAHRDASDRIKELTEKKNLNESILKKAMGDTFQLLDFGDAGRVYWTKKDDTRYFRNKIKNTSFDPL